MLVKPWCTMDGDIEYIDIETLLDVESFPLENNGNIVWRTEDGILHRKDGPAFKGQNCEAWYYFGFLHRADGPAIIKPNGMTEWYFRGFKMPIIPENIKCPVVIRDYYGCNGLSDCSIIGDNDLTITFDVDGKCKSYEYNYDGKHVKEFSDKSNTTDTEILILNPNDQKLSSTKTRDWLEESFGIQIKLIQDFIDVELGMILEKLKLDHSIDDLRIFNSIITLQFLHDDGKDGDHGILIKTFIERLKELEQFGEYIKTTAQKRQYSLQQLIK